MPPHYPSVINGVPAVPRRSLVIPEDMYQTDEFLTRLPRIIKSFNDARDKRSWLFVTHRYMLKVAEVNGSWVLEEAEGCEIDP